MKDPKPIHLTTDDEFRAQGWAAVARDKDGHAITLSADLDDTFDAWLRECFDRRLVVINLRTEAA